MDGVVLRRYCNVRGRVVWFEVCAWAWMDDMIVQILVLVAFFLLGKEMVKRGRVSLWNCIARSESLKVDLFEFKFWRIGNIGRGVGDCVVAGGQRIVA